MSDETMTQMREALETAQKELKRSAKQIDDLTKENRALQTKEALAGAELDPKLADLYLGVNPEGEITVESVKEFASSYGIASVELNTEGSGDEGTEEETNEEAPPQEGLQNVSRAGSRAGDGGQPPIDTKLMSTQEFVDLQKSNPVEAQKALAEGRVRLRSDNPLADGAGSPFSSRSFIPSAEE